MNRNKAFDIISKHEPRIEGGNPIIIEPNYLGSITGKELMELSEAFHFLKNDEQSEDVAKIYNTNYWNCMEIITQIINKL